MGAHVNECPKCCGEIVFDRMDGLRRVDGSRKMEIERLVFACSNPSCEFWFSVDDSATIVGEMLRVFARGEATT